MATLAPCGTVSSACDIPPAACLDLGTAPLCLHGTVPARWGPAALLRAPRQGAVWHRTRQEPPAALGGFHLGLGTAGPSLSISPWQHRCCPGRAGSILLALAKRKGLAWPGSPRAVALASGPCLPARLHAASTARHRGLRSWTRGHKPLVTSSAASARPHLPRATGGAGKGVKRFYLCPVNQAPGPVPGQHTSAAQP